MIQNIIAILIGALVTLLVLSISNANTREQYVTAIVIGGIANFAWPLVIGFWLGRRAKQRRENRIQEEVTRQMNQQK